MNLQDLINKRVFLTDSQQNSLITVIAFGKKQEVKRLIKEVIKNKFFTVFDGSIYSEKFTVKADEVVYNGSKKDLNDLINVILKGAR